MNVFHMSITRFTFGTINFIMFFRFASELMMTKVSCSFFQFYFLLFVVLYFLLSINDFSYLRSWNLLSIKSMILDSAQLNRF